MAGATGTGKTVTLQILAEGLSAAGVPVFAADVKGDLAGLSQPATANPKLAERAARTGPVEWAPAGAPVAFFDLFGISGHPVRTTVSEMGPLLLGRLLGLNETQEGVPRHRLPHGRRSRVAPRPQGLALPSSFHE